MNNETERCLSKKQLVENQDNDQGKKKNIEIKSERFSNQFRMVLKNIMTSVLL